MDTETLVDKHIAVGEKLLEELRQRGVEVAAALWLTRTDTGKLALYVVSPLVESQGPSQAYDALMPALRAVTQPFEIRPFRVRLIGPSDPMAQEVLAICSRAGNPWKFPMRWPGISLGGVSIEGAYLYPPPGPRSS